MLERQPVDTSWKQLFVFKDKEVMNKFKKLHLFQCNPEGLVFLIGNQAFKD